MVVNGKKTRFLLLATVTLAIAVVLALTGCSSGPAAKAQSADNKVTVTLNGAKDVSAFGQLKVKTGQGLKVTVAMTGGNADITVKDGSSSVYTTVPDDDDDDAAVTEEDTVDEKQPVSGNKEFGIELSTDGDMTIMVTGHEDARGTITFEVVSSDEVAELNSDGTDEDNEGDVEDEETDDNTDVDANTENSDESNENTADDTAADEAADNENNTGSDTTTSADNENTNENTANTE